MALRAARAGAAVLLESGLLRPGAPREAKAPGDYVTASDRLSEAAVIEVLIRESPGVAVLAEESGGTATGTMWAVDPLDGTTNFTRGFPVVGVSVALINRGMPEVGVVLAPYLNLEFTCARGKGAFLNSDRLPLLGAGEPSKAIIATGFPFRHKSRIPRHLSVLAGALANFEDVRRAGSAALDLAWTAAGTFNGFFELGLSAWDIAAGALLTLEVGATVTDWSGGQGWLRSGDIIAAPPAVHARLLELAAKAPEG
ncbi:MAG: inositol monophosphatase family protein [Candidatus Dormibacterales bacterium]